MQSKGFVGTAASCAHPFPRSLAADQCVVLPDRRREASQKEEELRSLVGGRYHDLLDSVDDAVRMFQCTEQLQALFQDLKGVRAQVLGLTWQKATPPTHSAIPAFFVHGLIIALGGRRSW